MFSRVLLTAISLFLFLCCEQKVIAIENTNGFIAFERNPKSDPIWDFDIWLINVYTKHEIRLTKSLEYWEFAPSWMSDSELIYLIEPQEKTGTETDMVYTNFKRGRSRLLDFWDWQNCPMMYKVSVDSLRNVYYYGWKNIYILARKENKYQLIKLFPDRGPEKFTPHKIGLEDFSSTVVSFDASKLLIVACDTAKYRRLQEVKKFHYDIYLYDLKGRSLERLTQGDSTYEDPAWIGKDSIVYTSNCDGNYELYIMELRSKKIVRLTSTPDISETQPAVSPDHKMVAYTRYDEKARISEIWIMDLGSKETYFLTAGSNPAWSPAK
ncbi:MAG: hypothetical protein ABIL18_03315 [candidate division WOR-3 bacterium]